MLESMTGTAASSFQVSGLQFQIWARSVNHRFVEIQLRCPRLFENADRLEQELEDRARRCIGRGRLEIEISASGETGGTRRLRFNRELAQEYLKVCVDLQADAAAAANQRSAGKSRESKPAVAETRPASPGMREMLQLLRLPGVVDLEQALPADFDRAGFFRRFDRTLTDLQKGRRKEGRSIAKILQTYLREIEQVDRRIRKRHALYKKEKLVSIRRDLKLSRDAAGNADSLKSAVDWLDKGDVSEELERVLLHCGAIRELIAGDAPDPGKQIEFYSQELLREVNTIGAKSRDFEIRRMVVEMKTRIENIKEQIRNIC
ncbi:MAG: DUF1732 domain-containing protein [Leptospirales bacterium]|jgi:uncharacterized protein YicC (UPF0701 family)